VIRLEGVTKTWPGNGADALRDVTLEVAHGETVCLIGSSGSGKTTALRLVNRLVEPSSGRVLVDGEDVTAVDVVALRRRIGYVIQSGGLFPHLTVRRNVSLLGELEGWAQDRIETRVAELLGSVGLEPDLFAERFPSQLSGGQRQRVGIARALFLDPEVLLLDEPLGALDPITRDELQGQLADLFRQLAKTTLLVSHDLEEAFRLADRVALLAHGELVQVGTLEEFRDAPETSHVQRFLEKHLGSE